MDFALGPRGRAGALRNSTGIGALLTASNSVSVASDDLVLLAERLPTTQKGLVWMAAGQHDLPFGDGRLCNALAVTFAP